MDIFFVLVAVVLIGGLYSAMVVGNLLHVGAYGAGLLVLLAAYRYAHRYERGVQKK